MPNEAWTTQPICPNRQSTHQNCSTTAPRLMYDLQVLAFQADLTRVISMMASREGSALSFPQIGTPEQRHSLSASSGRPESDGEEGEDRSAISSRSSRTFLQKLQATPDEDGSLLDHSP